MAVEHSPDTQQHISDRMLLDMDWMLAEVAIEDAEFFGHGQDVTESQNV